MRFKGKTIKEGMQIVVIPKGGVDIVIKAKAIRDYSRFDTMLPMPVPRMIQEPGQPNRPDFSDPMYQAAIDKRVELRTAWMILESLSISTDLVFETVDMNNPETWLNVFKELNETFSPNEQNCIHKIIAEANGLNNEKIEEATESFLAGLVAQEQT